jgi:hypothetical protein
MVMAPTRNLDTSLLRTFVAIVDQGGFARRLGITLRGRSLLDRGLAQLGDQPKLPQTPPLEIVLTTNPHASPAASAFARFVATLHDEPSAAVERDGDASASCQ